MRFTAAIAAVVLAGCTVYQGPGQERVSFDTRLEPDSVLTLATAQLEQQGYSVAPHDEGTIVTFAQPIPSEMESRDGASKPRYWILRVDAVQSALNFETLVHVSAYILPVRGNPYASRTTVPVTAGNPKLFAQVKQMAELVFSATRGRAVSASVTAQVQAPK